MLLVELLAAGQAVCVLLQAVFLLEHLAAGQAFSEHPTDVLVINHLSLVVRVSGGDALVLDIRQCFLPGVVLGVSSGFSLSGFSFGVSGRV